MKRIIILIAAISSLLLIGSCSRAEAKTASADIHFFYLELCPSCEEYEMAEDLAAQVAKMGGRSLNIIMAEDAEEMRAVLTEKGLADIAHVLPLLVEGKKYMVGYDEIAQRIDDLNNK